MHVHAGPFQLRKRFRYSDLQKYVLQKSFSENLYPTKITIHMLSEQLGLPVSRVQTWYQSRRRDIKLGKNIGTSPAGENECKPCVDWYCSDYIHA